MCVRESIFGLPVTTYAVLTDAITDFAPFRRLWIMCSEFAIARLRWMSGPFASLDATEVIDTVESWWKDCLQLQKKFKACVVD